MIDEKDKNETIEPIQIIDTTEKAEVSLDEEIKPEEPKKKEDRFLKEVLNYIILIAIAFGLAQLIHTYVFTPVTVEGRSMMTNLHDQDYVFLWRLGDIHRFDVIVFDVPDDTDPYIKRVIGLPGDYVKMDNDVLTINGETYPEHYLDKGKQDFSYSGNFTSNFNLQQICSISNVNCDIDGTIQIPKGYYLVLGDNRINSRDSRELGLIKEDRILGKAKFVIYPFNHFGKIEK